MNSKLLRVGVINLIIAILVLGAFMVPRGLAEEKSPFEDMSFELAALFRSYRATITKDKARNGLSVAYHAPCSLQHGQAIRIPPVSLLGDAGFEVVVPRDSHMCCGSAGSYSLLEPDLAIKLRDAKAAALRV